MGGESIRAMSAQTCNTCTVHNTILLSRVSRVSQGCMHADKIVIYLFSVLGFLFGAQASPVHHGACQ